MRNLVLATVYGRIARQYEYVKYMKYMQNIIVAWNDPVVTFSSRNEYRTRRRSKPMLMLPSIWP